MSLSTSTIQTLRENIKKELAGLYPEREIDSIIEVLFRFRLDLRRHETGMRKHEILMPPDREWFLHAINSLKDMTPVQYITGETEFFELSLKVGPAALIPRPETEELVRWILEYHAGDRCRILDIGTGSGCIALALAKNLPEATVYATDVHKETLDLAEENNRRLGLNVGFFLHDLNEERLPEGFLHLDLIVSNPPYIPLGERESMDANVRDFEPHAALFVPDEDPLLFYRHIARLSLQSLRPGGFLYAEIHENFGVQVHQLLEQNGFHEIEIRRDINGKDRMCKAKLG
ncbi:peptide chain release factor N(5)-glutamine methyltransferase [Bacteroidota bacterium]